jgi:hypothetical protein
MGQKYWLDRELSALLMASNASTSEARLIHFQLAGSYSLKAATFDPFMLPSELPYEHIATSIPPGTEVTSFFVSRHSQPEKLTPPRGFWQSCLLDASSHVRPRGVAAAGPEPA